MPEPLNVGIAGFGAIGQVMAAAFAESARPTGLTMPRSGIPQGYDVARRA